MILSAGGYGHIPIPLIKGEINFTEIPARFRFAVGFSGQVRPRLSRAGMLLETERACVLNHIS